MLEAIVEGRLVDDRQQVEQLYILQLDSLQEDDSFKEDMQVVVPRNPQLYLEHPLFDKGPYF